MLIETIAKMHNPYLLAFARHRSPLECPYSVHPSSIALSCARERVRACGARHVRLERPAAGSRQPAFDVDIPTSTIAGASAFTSTLAHTRARAHTARFPHPQAHALTHKRTKSSAQRIRGYKVRLPTHILCRDDADALSLGRNSKSIIALVEAFVSHPRPAAGSRRSGVCSRHRCRLRCCCDGRSRRAAPSKRGTGDGGP